MEAGRLAKKRKANSRNFPPEIIELILSFIPKYAWRLRGINSVWRSVVLDFLQRHRIHSDLPVLFPSVRIPIGYPLVFASKDFRESYEGIKIVLAKVEINNNAPLIPWDKISNVTIPKPKDTDIPSCFQKLVNMTSLDLVNHHVWIGGSHSPRSELISIAFLEPCVNLTTLFISFHSIHSVKELRSLVNLTSLYIIDNHLNSVEGLENLVKLTLLSLCENRLVSVEGLKGLVNLTILNLSHNKLVSVEGLENLVKLTHLNLFNNELVLVEGLKGLVNLTNLNLSCNQLVSVEGLEKLIKLTSLDLSDNELVSVESLKSFTQRVSIDLRRNYSLRTIPQFRPYVYAEIR
jgi:hypothetical protein